MRRKAAQLAPPTVQAQQQAAPPAPHAPHASPPGPSPRRRRRAEPEAGQGGSAADDDDERPRQRRRSSKKGRHRAAGAAAAAAGAANDEGSGSEGGDGDELRELALAAREAASLCKRRPDAGRLPAGLPPAKLAAAVGHVASSTGMGEAAAEECLLATAEHWQSWDRWVAGGRRPARAPCAQGCAPALCACLARAGCQGPACGGRPAS